MCGDGEVNNATPLVRQHQEHVQDLKPNGRHNEEVYGNEVLQMVFQEVRQVCEGGFRSRTRYLLTLVSPMSMPSLTSSP